MPMQQSHHNNHIRDSKMNKQIFAALLLGAASIGSAVAAPISIADFTSNQTIVTMNSVAAPAGNFSFSGIFVQQCAW